jgi:hypothetical protein
MATVSVLKMVPVLEMVSVQQALVRTPLYTLYSHLGILHDNLGRSVSIDHHRLYKRLSNPLCNLHKNLCKLYQKKA